MCCEGVRIISGGRLTLRLCWMFCGITDEFEGPISMGLSWYLVVVELNSCVLVDSWFPEVSSDLLLQYSLFWIDSVFSASGWDLQISQHIQQHSPFVLSANLFFGSIIYHITITRKRNIKRGHSIMNTMVPRISILLFVCVFFCKILNPSTLNEQNKVTAENVYL